MSFAAALAATPLPAASLSTWIFVPRAGPASVGGAVGVVVGVVVAEAVAEAVGELVGDGAPLAVLSSVSDENPGIFDDVPECERNVTKAKARAGAITRTASKGHQRRKPERDRRCTPRGPACSAAWSNSSSGYG